MMTPPKTLLKHLLLTSALSGAGVVFAQSPDMPGNWSEQQIEQQQQRPRSAENGDEAMKKGNFSTAASFYNEYRQEAKRRNDKTALKDAYECEINALIRGENAKQAQKTLAEFKKDFPKHTSLSISLCEANLLLFQKKTDDAIKALREILQTLQNKNPHDPHRIHALTALATAYEIKSDYKSAVGCYRELLKDSVREVDIEIKLRYVYTLIANGDTTEAGKVLNEINPGTNERILEAHRLLSIYLAIRNKQEDQLGSSFKFSDESSKTGSGSFFFILASKIGDEYSKNGNFEKALDAYRLAFFYAKTNRDGVDAMTRIIFVFDGLKDPGKAAALALKHFAFFMEPKTSTELKSKVALLLTKSGNSAKALELFERVFKESTKERNTFRNAYAYLLKQKKFDDAAKLVNLFYKKDSPGASICYAEIAASAGNKKNAARLYERAAEKNPDQYEKLMNHAIMFMVDLKDHDQVIRLTSDLLKKVPTSQAIFFRAKSKEAKKDLKGARQDYLAYTKLQNTPSSRKSECYFLAGEAAWKLEDPRNAAKDFRNALTLGIEHKTDKTCATIAPEAGYWLVMCCLTTNDLKGAETAANQLSEHFSDSFYYSEAFWKMANYLETAGELQAAELWLKRLEERKLSNTVMAETLYRRAVLNFREQDDRETEKLLTAVIQEYEKDQPPIIADVYYLYGDLLKKQKKFADAVRKYEKVLQ